MHTKSILASMTLFFVGLFTLSFNISAQNSVSITAEKSTKNCSGEKFVMPSSIPIGNQAFSDFIKVMSVPSEKYRMFSDSSAEVKANVYKIKLALFFIKKPNLNKEQKEVILQAISMLTADFYDKNSAKQPKLQREAEALQTKAFIIFPKSEADEIFSDLHTDDSAYVKIIKNYEELLSLPMGERKNRVFKASPTEKNNFWKAQMLYYLVASTLTEKQKSFIVDVFPLMSDDAFNVPTEVGQSNNEFFKTLEAFITTGKELFSKEEFFTVFMGYGIHKTVVDNSLPSADCDCNYICGIGYTCKDNVSCAIRKACGILGGSDCENRCMPN